MNTVSTLTNFVEDIGVMRHATILMVGERRAIELQLSRTPKWRKIKRYRMLERHYSLSEIIEMIDHILCED